MSIKEIILMNLIAFSGIAFLVVGFSAIAFCCFRYIF
jgi:hypothetical protein